MEDSDKPLVMFASIGGREDHVEHSLTQKKRSNAESTVSQAKLVEQKPEFWREKLANPAKPRLFTYLMTHDHGFAPNPFHGVLTLATCKPGMRRTKKVGDWIAGFSSATLEKSCKKIPSQGLIYLAQISEVLAFEEYFTDSRFEKKKPVINGDSSVDTEATKGDNIYFKNDHGILEQLPNANHDHRSISNDLGGKNVLISQKFYYFGENCRVPPCGWSSINCRIPDGRPTAYGYENESSVVENILAFLGEWKSEILPGIHGKPCFWKD